MYVGWLSRVWRWRRVTQDDFDYMVQCDWSNRSSMICNSFENSSTPVILTFLCFCSPVPPPPPRHSGHTSAVSGGNVHPERDPGGVLPGCHQQCFPMVPGGCGTTGAPLHFVARCLSGLYTRTQTSRQRHSITFPFSHRLQHPGPEHSAGLRQGRRVPPQVRLGLKPLYSCAVNRLDVYWSPVIDWWPARGVP